MRPRWPWACWRTRRPASRRRICGTESALADRMESARGRHWMRVIPFARATRAAAIDERTKGALATAPYRRTRRATARIWKRPSATAPPRCPPAWCRACCCSPTATRTLGSVARAIWQAQQLGIPIDTVPLAGRPKPGLLLESVSLPGPGLQRRALSRGGDPGIAARALQGHRGDDGRGQIDRHRAAWNCRPAPTICACRPA